MQNSWQQALRLAVPALVIVWLVLLPFLGMAFTIDDTFYLREAQQALLTPLHPTSVLITWDGTRTLRDEEVPLSTYTSVGPGPALVMLPAALAGMKERDVH